MDEAGRRVCSVLKKIWAVLSYRQVKMTCLNRKLIMMNTSVCRWQALPNKPNLYAFVFLYSFEKEICSYRCKGYSLCVVGCASRKDLYRPGNIYAAFKLKTIRDDTSA